MKNPIPRRVALTALLLTACFGGAETAPALISMAARNGALWSHELLSTGTVAPAPIPRPSAMLGPYVAAFLSLPFANMSHAAVSGVLAATSLAEGEGVRDESYALLEELGLVLQADVPDLLNRSLDRQIALDAYREGLIDVSQRSQEHQTLLESQQDDANAMVREVRGQASEIQRALSDALRLKDYATASSRQAELSDVQGELAVATAKQKEISSIIALFKQSLDTAAERLTAIDANREALIAGVSVTDIPGSEDIGVLQQAERGRRRANPDDVFGPTSPDQ